MDPLQSQFNPVENSYFSRATSDFQGVANPHYIIRLLNEDNIRSLSDYFDFSMVLLMIRLGLNGYLRVLEMLVVLTLATLGLERI